MIIMKFGGTSVQDAAAIRRVGKIVRGRLGEQPLVVVSAMSGVTRQLLTLARESGAQHEQRVARLLEELRDRHLQAARELTGDGRLFEAVRTDLEALLEELERFSAGVCQIGELSPRSQARILSVGERLSSRIVAAAMEADGLTCRLVDARRLILTDDRYLSARPDMEATQAAVRRIVPPAARGVDLVLTQGFIASTGDGAASVLGFEGSDYSAAIFAQALGASRVEIWTDVDGIRTADPRIVPDTARIDRLSYAEAAEMAWLGARVLHPLTIEPARRLNIPIHVYNTMHPDAEGTVVQHGDGVPAGPKSVALRTDVDFVMVHAPRAEGLTPLLRLVLDALGREGVTASLVCAGEADLSLTLPAGQAGWEAAVRDLESNQLTVTCFHEKAQISVIGEGVAVQPDLLPILLEEAGGADLVCQGPTRRSVSLVTHRSRAEDTVRRIHARLNRQFLSNP